MVERAVHGQRRDRDETAGYHGRERVSGRIESARIKPLRRPEHQGERKPKEVGGGGLRVRENEVPVRQPVYQVDHREGGPPHHVWGREGGATAWPRIAMGTCRRRLA